MTNLAVLLVLAACATDQAALEPDDAAPPEPVVTASATPSPSSSPPTPTPAATPKPTRRPPAAPNPGEHVAIEMPAKYWAGIDGGMDNLISTSIEGGEGFDVLDAAKGGAIRELGWDQVPWVGPKKDWPPMDQRITITLSRAQWAFVLRDIRDSIPIYDEIDPPRGGDGGREIRDFLVAELAKAKGTMPAPGPGKPVRHKAYVDNGELHLTPFAARPMPDDWALDRLMGAAAGPSVVIRTGACDAPVDLTIRKLDAPPAPLADSLAGWEVGEEDTIEINEALQGMTPMGIGWYRRDVFVPDRPEGTASACWPADGPTSPAIRSRLLRRRPRSTSR